MEHDKVDELFDEQFDRAVKEHFLIDIPHPRVSWEKVSQRLMAERKRRSRRRMVRFIAVSVASILIGAAAIGTPGVSSAFSPLSELVRGVKVDIYTFFYGDPANLDNPRAKTSAPPDHILGQISGEARTAEQGLPISVESLTVETAAKEAAFELIVPAYAPEGYELFSVTGFRDGYRHLVRINFLYHTRDNATTYTVEQILIASDFEYRLTSDPSASDSKDVTVNGQKGAMFTFSDGSSKIIWTEKGTLRIITGKLPEEEMMKIAALE